MNDSRDRRALLPTRQNEHTSLDFVVSVEFSLALPVAQGEGRLMVRYVPDRLLLATEIWRPGSPASRPPSLTRSNRAP